jgi:hypothetical protein
MQNLWGFGMREPMAKESAEFYSEAETKRRADATLKRLLATPHKPQKPLGKRKRKAKRKAKA